MIGKVLGNRYEVLEKIGTGGMGDVYKAHCRKLDRIVAIKILKAEYNDDNNFIRKFKRESLAAASISHPNIVSIYDVGSEEIDSQKVHYIVMEYIDGKTLKEVINEEGRLNEKRALNYCVQIAEALKVAHSKNIVHRDIKSQNIMVTKDDRVKVTDFGIARVADNSTVTATNAIMGSVHYFSPEQARGTKVDNRSDIYSLGIVLYEMLTGKLPFDAENPVSVALMQVQSNMPKPSSRYSDISSMADSIVLKMTMKEPNDRYADVYSLIKDIKDIQFGRTTNFNYTNSSSRNTMPVNKSEIAASRDKKVVRRNTPKPERVIEKEVKKKKKSSFTPVLLGILCALLLFGLLIFVVPKIMSGNNTDVDKVERVSVINIVGLDEKEAEAKLKAIGLVMEQSGVEEREDKNNREILSQSPKEGEQVEKGTSVSVVVNIVEDSIKVPNLVNKTLEEAQRLAKDSGLNIIDIQMDYSDTVESDRIISQEPQAESEVSKKQGISIRISKGAEDKSKEIPNIRGLTEAQAKATLEKVGFVVDVKYIKANNVDRGDVSRYEPEGVADKGSTITIYVSEGPKEDGDLNPSDGTSTQNSLSVDLPNDGQRHKVTVYRFTPNGGEYKIYDYMKSADEGTVLVPLDYAEHGDKFEIYVDDEKVRTEVID
ncbi:Stk1 family PASTA domain-containing Ser/Thr kinase [Peptoniphilus mikwangii]|uniref:Stk1 family PASTA domain-containing Ser/Thr kinase n=1 Tax=Peptoniphilus mikwangii TaxID=1354300 RepID=UPI000419286F|nr:Stk1 family PASTA domain-containing Ser/Thr kinase [Peptoniphilus mikwangii]